MIKALFILWCSSYYIKNKEDSDVESRYLLRQTPDDTGHDSII